MASKIFLDASVILEAFLQRKQKDSASKVLMLIAERKAKGYTTSSVIQICVYFLEKEMTGKEVANLFILFLCFNSLILLIPAGKL